MLAPQQCPMAHGASPPPPTSNPHLVHEDKGSLKGTVHALVCWVHDALGLDLCTAQFQIVVPQFVAMAGGREGGREREGREQMEGGRKGEERRSTDGESGRIREDGSKEKGTVSSTDTPVQPLSTTLIDPLHSTAKELRMVEQRCVQAVETNLCRRFNTPPVIQICTHMHT